MQVEVKQIKKGKDGEGIIRLEIEYRNWDDAIQAANHIDDIIQNFLDKQTTLQEHK